MSRPLEKTLLIVCEGEETEPGYFYDLQKIIDKKNLAYRITIVPKPHAQKQEEASQINEEKINTGRPKRKLKKIPDEHLLPEIIPEEFRGQPTRYVWYAQNGLDTYDEVWSVYDKDGHPFHEQAYALANERVHEGKKVNIAFSSIAFELWYLLHFEARPFVKFKKAHCRTKGKPDNCGKGIQKDCKGNLCIAGYIKTKGYMSPEGNIKTFRYAPIAHKTEFAMENALNLRRQVFTEQMPIYDLNPYTDVDKLIFKLLHLERDYNGSTLILP